MSNIIAITSGKGGAGKSTVSAGIGQALAKRGKKTVVIELDAGLRGLDIMLGVENQVVYDLGDLVSGACSLDDAAVSIDGCPNLFLIAAPTMLPEGLDKPELAQVIQALSSWFDYVILDLPAGIRFSLQLIPRLADMTVIVATPDYVSVRDSNRVASALTELGVTNCRLLINKVNTKYRKMNIIKDLDEVLDGVGVPLLGVLPEDLQIKSVFSCGGQLEKETAPAVIFERIAARIEGEYTPLYII